MSKVALAAALGLLLFFTWLTGIRPAYAFAYALCLLGAGALGGGPRSQPDPRLPAGPRHLGERRPREMEVPRRLPPAGLDRIRTDLAASARTFRPLRQGAQAHTADVGPRLPAGQA